MLKKKVAKTSKKLTVTTTESLPTVPEEITITQSPNIPQELAGHHQPKQVVVDNQLRTDTSKGVVIDFRP